MAVSRYWRIVGICTAANAPLELSEARIYDSGVLADASATLTSSFAPDTGALADLRDGVTTSVVSWDFASHSAPTFALTWDFGVGGGVEFPSLQFGSGDSADTFPVDLIVQSSTDGVTWTYYWQVVALTYPGYRALTASPAGMVGDFYYANVVLLLQFEGANNATVFTDSSRTPKTFTVTAPAKISTAQAAHGLASGLFDGASASVQTPYHSDFAFGAADFTVEAAVYLTRNETTYAPVVVSLWSNAAGWAWELRVNANMSGFLFVVNGVAYASASQALSINTWYRVAVARVGGYVYMFIDGVLKSTIAAVTINATGADLVIGRVSAPAVWYFPGYIDAVRITKGVGRYSANYTVGAFPDLAYSVAATASPAPHRVRNTPPTQLKFAPADAMPDGSAHGHLREVPFFDAYHGGVGIVYGTVKEKNLPANTPLHRRVLLLDERSMLAIRETWSDATTGAYEFRGVRQDIPYTVVAYDYTTNYRAVVADNITAEAIP